MTLSVASHAPTPLFGKLTVRKKSIEEYAPDAEAAQKLLGDLKRMRRAFDPQIKNMETLGLDIEVGMDRFTRWDGKGWDETVWREGFSDAEKASGVAEEKVRCVRDWIQLAKEEPVGVGLYIKAVDRSTRKPVSLSIQNNLPKDIYPKFQSAVFNMLGLVDASGQVTAKPLANMKRDALLYPHPVVLMEE